MVKLFTGDAVRNMSPLARIVAVLRNLKYLPAIVRMVNELVNAEEDAARANYISAERRLVRIYGLAPPGAIERSRTNLLMALVSLRLGNLQVAADLAPTAVSQVAALRVSANPSERAYLQYVGRVIVEEATRRLGAPKTIDVGVDYADLDLRKVRSSLRDAFPVCKPDNTTAPQLH